MGIVENSKVIVGWLVLAGLALGLIWGLSGDLNLCDPALPRDAFEKCVGE